MQIIVGSALPKHSKLPKFPKLPISALIDVGRGIGNIVNIVRIVNLRIVCALQIIVGSALPKLLKLPKLPIPALKLDRT